MTHSGWRRNNAAAGGGRGSTAASHSGSGNVLSRNLVGYKDPPPPPVVRMPFFNSLIREFFDLDASIRSMPAPAAAATECTNVVKAYQTNTVFGGGGGGMSTVALSRTQTFKCRSVGNVGALVNAASRGGGMQPRIVNHSDARYLIRMLIPYVVDTSRLSTIDKQLGRKSALSTDYPSNNGLAQAMLGKGSNHMLKVQKIFLSSIYAPSSPLITFDAK